jgi:hypothetical protein
MYNAKDSECGRLVVNGRSSGQAGDAGFAAEERWHAGGSLS